MAPIMKSKSNATVQLASDTNLPPLINKTSKFKSAARFVMGCALLWCPVFLMRRSTLVQSPPQRLRQQLTHGTQDWLFGCVPCVAGSQNALKIDLRKTTELAHNSPRMPKDSHQSKYKHNSARYKYKGQVGSPSEGGDDQTPVLML